MTKKLELYLKAEKTILDKKDRLCDQLLAEFDKAKLDWETAVQVYNSYLTYLRRQRFYVPPPEN